MLKKFSLASLATFALPMVSLAASAPIAVNTGYVTNLITSVRTILGYLVPLFVSLAIVILLYYIVKYIAGGAQDKGAARDGIIWSIIAIVVMLSIWGLVALVQNIFGLENSQNSANLPQLPTVQVQ